MAGGWGCPHEVDDRCGKLGGVPCDPGIKGCVLAGRYRFLDDDKSQRFLEKKAREKATERTDVNGDNTLEESRKCETHHPLPLQGGGREGDGE